MRRHAEAGARCGGVDGGRRHRARARTTDNGFYSPDKQARLQAFAAKEVPWASMPWYGDRTSMGALGRGGRGRTAGHGRASGRRLRVRHVAGEDVRRAWCMDQRARACLGLRTTVERRGMARRSGAPGPARCRGRVTKLTQLALFEMEKLQKLQLKCSKW
jgi:hypothetical protein